MRALVKTERLRGHVVLREVELPKPQKDDVLIRIHAASVCGSDLHAYRYDPSYSFMAVPVILGHELSGIVEEVGEGVTDVKPGDRVIVESNVSCGRCAYCLAGDHHICEHYRVRGLHLDGGFAEYICTKVYDVHRIRADLDLLRAVWTEPLVVVVHAIKDRAQIREGDYVAVFGPGPIGILAAQVIRTVGAVPVIIGLGSDEEARLPAARALGIRTVNLSKQAIGKVMGELKCGAFDCIIDCSGSTTAIETGISVLKKRRAVDTCRFVFRFICIRSFDYRSTRNSNRGQLCLQETKLSNSVGTVILGSCRSRIDHDGFQLGAV